MIVIGNIISFLSCSVNIYSGFVKKHTLFLQTVAVCLMSVAYLLLGSFVGVLSNILSIIRNYLSLKDVLFLWVKVLLCVGFVLILLIFPDNSNIYVFLLVIPYTLLLNDDEIRIKILTIVTTIPWIIFNVFVQNYVGAVFNSVLVVAYCVGLYRVNNP